MIRNIKRTWFEVWGTEEAQNRFLKGLLTLLISLFVVETVSLLILSLRSPTLIAVSSTESKVLSVTPPKPELLQNEVKRVVQGYFLSHYNWEYQKIKDSFNKASEFVSPDYKKTFFKANTEQEKMVLEKKLSQHFYIQDIQIDFKSKSAVVKGDRILIVENLRAASSLLLQVGFDFGPRTAENPEGVYITAEKLLTGGK